MTRQNFRLLIALGVSAAVHVAPMLAPYLKIKPLPPPPLQVTLQAPPPPVAVPEPVLPLPEPREEKNAVEPSKPVPPPPPSKASRPDNWHASIARQLNKMNAEGLLYSREAIAAGQEGTVVVLIVLDDDGKVVATRVEDSSGHALLDRDARNAAMRLLPFPPEAPREFPYPIRFRLR